MACTMRGDWYGGNASLPAGSSAETGVTFSLDDAKVGTTPVAIPGTAGTKFSWFKNLGLDVTGTGSTTINNRTIAISGALTTGLFLFYQAVASASYAQPTSGNKPADSGSNGNTPAGYTAIGTSTSQYDNTSVSSGSTGLNGKLCQCVAGVDNTYTGGAGSAISLNNILLAYDEA